MEIKKFIKQITLGEMVFNVGSNRNILVDVLENNEEYAECIFSQSEKSKDNNTDKVDFKSLIKNKKMGEILKLEELIPEVVKYALPKMLEFTGETISADDIIAYAEENQADDILYEALHDLLIKAFTSGKQDKQPKIKFAIN